MATEHASWLEQVREEPLDAGLPICDPHHHLWDTPKERYLVDELRADTGAGHNVVCTVYVECNSAYRNDGPDELRPVGEIEFARDQADEGLRSPGAAIAGIVGYADLRLGERVAAVLEAEADAGNGRFRGIRHATAWDADLTISRNRPGSPPGLMNEPVFRDGLRVLARMGLSFDAWLYHPQIGELAQAARAVPELTIVLDHLGAPLGVGPYVNRAEMLPGWRNSIAELATCPNVAVKLGGIGMPNYGFAWRERPLPPTSEELATTWGDEIRFCIDAFGPERAMFESNFPVDRRSCSYVVLWNAFKRIATRYSPTERSSLFHDSASRAYRLASTS